MKSLFIFVLVLVAFVAFSGPGASWAQTLNTCNPHLSFGTVTHFNERIQTAIVRMDTGRVVTLDFRRSVVGVCDGALSNPGVSALPHVGDSVVLRANVGNCEGDDTCPSCLARC